MNDEIRLDPSAWDQLIKDIDIDYSPGALTISNTGTAGPFSLDHVISSNWKRGLSVDGDINLSADHDIRLGDVSLKKMLEDIQQRLNILRPNPSLENQWEELRVLGEKYRALEQEILAKQAMWAALKQSSRQPENT
jgi:hypothetical protein